MNTIEERVRKLEQQVGYWRVAASAVILLAVAGLSIGASHNEIPETLRCRNLQIVNEAGETVVSLDHWMLGGRIDLRNADGNRTTTIAQSDAGNGMIRVYSSDGHNLVYAGAGKGSDGGLVAIYTTSGETLVSAGSDDQGNGELEVHFRNGKVATVKP